MKKAYIAGPLFDDHEREYLEKIAQIVESYGISTFVPHRDAGLVTGDFTFEKKVKVFDVDMEYLEPADIVIALLTGGTLIQVLQRKLVMHTKQVKD